MADFDTAGILDVGGDSPITAAGRAQVAHFGESALFCLVLDQRAILADPPAERPIAAEILPGAPLMALLGSDRNSPVKLLMQRYSESPDHIRDSSC